jgi:hypothetical protein
MTGPGSAAEFQENTAFQSLEIPSNLWKALERERFPT